MKNSFNSEADYLSFLETYNFLPLGFKVAYNSVLFNAEEISSNFKMNLNLIVPDSPCRSFAGVFTQNSFCGAPVTWNKSKLENAEIQALLINNKIANVATKSGIEDIIQINKGLESLLKIDSNNILVASTGVIGWKLPVNDIINNLSTLVQKLGSNSILDISKGIMTTDLYPKIRSIKLSSGSIVGIAKGAGMIEPNLATMLCFIFTDIKIEKNRLQDLLFKISAETFNNISVDTDQSTSDMILALSSNLVDNTDVNEFEKSLYSVCKGLAGDIVRNGEGTRHVIKALVTGCDCKESSRAVAKSVVNSPLVKCAIAGNDPNIGRILMAIGKASFLYPKLDTSKCKIYIGGKAVFENNSFNLDLDLENFLNDYLKSKELYLSSPTDQMVFKPTINYPKHYESVEIKIEFNSGTHSCECIGSDLTHEYVSENADYRS